MFLFTITPAEQSILSSLFILPAPAAQAIFPNFKASSDMHIWNVVNVNGQWLNLDLTWDDPISIDGLDYLEYDFFLIDSQRMLKLEKKEHNFNADTYPEIAY